MTALEAEIVRRLVSEGQITEDQAAVWEMRNPGALHPPLSFRAIRSVMRRPAMTCWRWYQHVQYLVEAAQSGDEGRPLAGRTLKRSGPGPTPTPFVVDPVLRSLGF